MSPAPKARVAVLVFPASNDAHDLGAALERCGAGVRYVWHKAARLPDDVQGVALAGGFSYGDYLRPGAMARFSPIMSDVIERVQAGLPALGVCNGFQVLCEAGLLPGALTRNRSRRFICRAVRVEVADTGCFPIAEAGRTELEIPIKHGHGAYVRDPRRPARVAFRYLGSNPNGSEDAIAGVASESGRVLGLMPHPEHAVDPLLGGIDGTHVLGAFADLCAGGVRA